MLYTHSWSENKDVASVTSADFVEVVFHVVTVDLGPTEDDRLVHLVNVDRPQRILAFQYLHRFRQHFCNVAGKYLLIFR